MRAIIIALLTLFLLSCARSPTTQFYILNPLPPQKVSSKNFTDLSIGIDSINLPAYVEKPQLMIHYAPHRLALEEYHQWAEALDKNVVRVVRTNLATLLPKAVVEASPWDSKFLPNYHLQITISQFEIDAQGNSLMRAEYLIYHYQDRIKKRTLYYQQHTSSNNIASLVGNLNESLSYLSRDLAKVFSTLP